MTLRRRRRPPAAVEPQDTDAQHQLSQLEAEVLQLRRALDALPIGVVLADAAGHTMVENTAARGYHGHAAVLVQEAVERHVRRAVRGDAGGATGGVLRPPRTGLAVPAHPP